MAQDVKTTALKATPPAQVTAAATAGPKAPGNAPENAPENAPGNAPVHAPARPAAKDPAKAAAKAVAREIAAGAAQLHDLRIGGDDDTAHHRASRRGAPWVRAGMPEAVALPGYQELLLIMAACWVSMASPDSVTMAPDNCALASKASEAVGP